MDGLKEILPVILAIGFISLLWLRAIKWHPSWAPTLTVSWRDVNSISLAFGVLAAWVSYAGFRDLDFWPLTGVTVSSTVIAYSFMQSAFTDPQVRSVDRKTLYLSMIAPLAVHGWVLSRVEDNPVLVIWIALMMASGALVFLPGLMGPSDGRALLLAAVAAFPILGINWFSYALGGFLGLLVLYSLVMSGVAARRESSSFLKELLAKRSLPAVPFILFPFMVAIPLIGFIQQ